MQKQFSRIWIELPTVEPGRVVVYVVIYTLWGYLMNWFGTAAEIAKFVHWWQVVTVYLLYMVPISIILRNQSWHFQYAYGLIAMGLLEFSGYALKTSYAYPDNILDQYFNVRNFSLAMTLFFGLYFPLGNWLVNMVYSRLAKVPVTKDSAG